INHRLSLHGRHSEHARADRVATDLQNLSRCFHPHCGRDHSRPLCNRLSPAASFPFTGSSRPTCLLPASRARPFHAAVPKPTNLPDENSLLVSAAYDAARGHESLTPLWHCSNRIQDRTHLGARRLEAARGVQDKIYPVALLVIRIRGIDLRDVIRGPERGALRPATP